jgi:hypothetical protein
MNNNTAHFLFFSTSSVAEEEANKQIYVPKARPSYHYLLALSTAGNNIVMAIKNTIF